MDEIPAFVVVDMTDGYVWSRDKFGNAFVTEKMATHFATGRNLRTLTEPYKVFRLVPVDNG